MSLPESIFASGKPEMLLGVCLFNLLFAVQTPGGKLQNVVGLQRNRLVFFLKELKIVASSCTLLVVLPLPGFKSGCLSHVLLMHLMCPGGLVSREAPWVQWEVMTCYWNTANCSSQLELESGDWNVWVLFLNSKGKQCLQWQNATALLGRPRDEPGSIVHLMPGDGAKGWCLQRAVWLWVPTWEGRGLGLRFSLGFSLPAHHG